MNIREFVKAFWAFGLAISIEKLLGFVLVPLYTAYFNVAEYGVIDLIQTIVIIGTVFGMIQMESSLQRFYFEFSGQKQKLFISNLFLAVLVLSFGVVVIGLFSCEFIARELLDDIRYIEPLRVSIIQIPFINLSILGLIIIRFDKKNLKFTILVCIKVFLALLFVGIFVVFLKFGISGVFIAQLATSILSCLAVMFAIREKFPRLELNRRLLKEALNYGLPQFPARIGSIANSYGNRFFLVSFLSISAIGVFSVSLKWASIIQLLYTCFIMAWNPFVFSRLKSANFKQVFAKALPLIGCLLFCTIAFMACFSLEIIELLTSPEYANAHTSVGILSLYYALFIVKEVVDIGPKAEKKTIYVSYNFAFSTLINVILLFVLTPRYGINGVCIAMLISNFALVASSWYNSNRLVYIPYNIKQFILLIIPIIGLCFSMLFVSPGLSIRVAIFLIIGGFYLGYFFRLFHLYKRELA